MHQDPKGAVVKLIERTGDVIQSLDKEPLNARRYQRLQDDITNLSERIDRLRRGVIIAVVIACVALLLSVHP